MQWLSFGSLVVAGLLCADPKQGEADQDNWVAARSAPSDRVRDLEPAVPTPIPSTIPAPSRAFSSDSMRPAPIVSPKTDTQRPTMFGAARAGSVSNLPAPTGQWIAAKREDWSPASEVNPNRVVDPSPSSPTLAFAFDQADQVERIDVAASELPVTRGFLDPSDQATERRSTPVHSEPIAAPTGRTDTTATIVPDPNRVSARPVRSRKKSVLASRLKRIVTAPGKALARVFRINKPKSREKLDDSDLFSSQPPLSERPFATIPYAN